MNDAGESNDNQRGAKGGTGHGNMIAPDTSGKSTGRTAREVVYPSRDGRPIGETPLHRDILWDLVAEFSVWYAADPQVYVSGNMMMYYEPGDKRRLVLPDVFVTKGIPKLPERDVYLVWKEGRGPDLVIELSSKSTRKEDQNKKYMLYRDVLRVREYFLFDPRKEYLDPRLQGYRLMGDQYVPIEPTEGRLISEVCGLHLETSGTFLRLYDPASGHWLPTPKESVEQAKVAQQQSKMAQQLAESAQQQAESENERLRRQLDALRARLGNGS